MGHRNAVCTDGGCAVAAATLVAEMDAVGPLTWVPVHETADTSALGRLSTTAGTPVAVQVESAGRENAISEGGPIRTSDKQSKND